MLYNVLIKTYDERYNLWRVTENNLHRLVQAYNFGKDSVFLSGKKHMLNGLEIIRIYTCPELISTVKECLEFAKANGHFSKDSYGNVSYNEMTLAAIGNDCTDYFIKDDYGYLRETQINNATNNYVDQKRINELISLTCPFDLTRLIKYLTELNDCHRCEANCAVIMLLRAILDHVPPLFSAKSFSEVCNNHANKSIKDNLVRLDNSSRTIADAYLHIQIRTSETIPTITQVNFTNDLDVLLAEIIRKYK